MCSQDEIVAENERFFAPFGSTLINCALRYNLFLEKYRHDAPCWTLSFSAPQGGSAEVHICRASNTTVRIAGVWYVDDYDCGTRSIKETAKPEVERRSDLVENGVVTALKALKNFKLGEWTQVATGYRGFWSRTWTKEQFEQFQHRFPVPNLDSLV